MNPDDAIKPKPSAELLRRTRGRDPYRYSYLNRVERKQRYAEAALKQKGINPMKRDIKITDEGLFIDDTLTIPANMISGDEVIVARRTSTPSEATITILTRGNIELDVS